MRRTITLAALVLVAILAVTRPAAADTTNTLAKTFALTLAGTLIGAYGLPYVTPVIAPVVGPAYVATASAVNGVLAPIMMSPPAVATGYAAMAGGINSALTTAGSYMVLQPRLVGAVAGMTAGLVGGIYVFSDPVEEVQVGPVETSNTVVQLQR